MIALKVLKYKIFDICLEVIYERLSRSFSFTMDPRRIDPRTLRLEDTLSEIVSERWNVVFRNCFISAVLKTQGSNFKIVFTYDSCHSVHKTHPSMVWKNPHELWVYSEESPREDSDWKFYK